MDEIEWQPLPPLWSPPAVWATHGRFELLVFAEAGVPTWEVYLEPDAGRRKVPARLLAHGTADCFRAAQAAALDTADDLASRSGG